LPEHGTAGAIAVPRLLIVSFPTVPLGMRLIALTFPAVIAPAIVTLRMIKAKRVPARPIAFVRTTHRGGEMLVVDWQDEATIGARF